MYVPTDAFCQKNLSWNQIHVFTSSKLHLLANVKAANDNLLAAS